MALTDSELIQLSEQARVLGLEWESGGLTEAASRLTRLAEILAAVPHLINELLDARQRLLALTPPKIEW